MRDKIFSGQNTKEFISKAPSPSPSPSRGEGCNISPPLRGGDEGECDVSGFTNDRISNFNFKSAIVNCRKGFTLLEVLVSLALMGIALVVIFQLFSAGLRGVAASDDYVNAVIRAEAKMREILDDQNLPEKSWKEITEDGYTIEATVNSTANDRTENLQVKLLEINLTVHWTNGIKERALTLKTMKVVDKKI